MRPVRQGAVHSLCSRLFCGPLKMRRVPQEPVFGTEYLFRTVEACFLHRMPPKMRRVPQEAFLSTARMFRTIGGPLRYRMPDTEAGCRRSEAWRTKKEADHNMFLALFDLLVAVDPTVGANMARGLWAAYAAGSLSSTYA